MAYLGQAYCDWKQGDTEKKKAEDLKLSAQKWIDSLDDDLLKSWRAEAPENDCLCEVLSHHMERIIRQQGLEVAGGIVREVKAGANVISASGSMSVAALQQMTTVYKPAPANIVGTFISAVSTSYMTFTATKMYRRGDALVDSKRRREDARLLEAMFDVDDVKIQMANKRQLVQLQVPAGKYDEQTGFQTTLRDVSPSTNEHLAAGMLARQLARITDPKLATPSPGSLLGVLQHGWKMPVIELWAMLTVAMGMQDDHRRLDFLRNRLAPLFKTDFPLVADTQRAAPLSAEVLVDRAINHLSRRAAFASRITILDDSTRTSRKHVRLAARLYKQLVEDGFFKQFNEDDFFAAVKQVWSARTQSNTASDAKSKLYQVRLVADHIASQREDSGVIIMKKMRNADAKKLATCFSEDEVNRFREQLLLYLNTQVLCDGKAKAEATSNLSGMPLVQRLIRESTSMGQQKRSLFSTLECCDDIRPILDVLDVDRMVEKVDDSDDIIITLSDSGESDSDSDADNGNGTTTVINIGGLIKGVSDQVGDDSGRESKDSTEGSISGDLGAAPIFTPRRRARIVQRVFDKEALRREKLMAALEHAVGRAGKVDNDVDDVLSYLAESSVDADEVDTEDKV